MKPYRKRYDTHTLFPFSFVFRDTKTVQNELPDHLHDWYELVYVHTGSGTLFIDSVLYEMRQGDLFIIPSNTIHRAIPDQANPVTSTAIFFSSFFLPTITFDKNFSFLAPFHSCKAQQSYKFECSEPMQSMMESLLSEIDMEMRESSIGYREAISFLVQKILLSIHRGIRSHNEPLQHSPALAPAWLREALLYIDVHYTDPTISLSELSHRAFISTAHFSRSFKQLTGMNVTNFITTKRIIKAKELLRTTELSIASIALDCGFNGLPHFHRMFKHYVQLTPSAYRSS